MTEPALTCIMPMSGYRQTWHHRPVRDADFSGVGADMESQ
jgi:hypothetical protein